jgi:CO/xanthine dehydrogenase Mo-binding subunit
MGATEIGAAVRRTEDQRFIAGKGRYVADFHRPGQTHAYVIRSPNAHAKINGINGAAAMAMPGVLAVVTGEELPCHRHHTPVARTAKACAHSINAMAASQHRCDRHRLNQRRHHQSQPFRHADAGTWKARNQQSTGKIRATKKIWGRAEAWVDLSLLCSTDGSTGLSYFAALET